MNKVILFVILMMTVMLVGSKAESWGEESTPKYEIIKKSTNKTKLNSKINEVETRMKSMGVTRSGIRAFNAEDLSTPLVKVSHDGDIQSYIYLSEFNDRNLNELSALDVTIEITNEEHKVVQGWVPFEKLEDLEGLSFVEKVTPPAYGSARTGSVTTEGDAIMNSDDVRTNLGFNGSGVLVGVISDGIDDIEASKATDDIPDIVIVGESGSGNEGTALMEIIHDIAPGASLAFSSGGTSVLFINSINFLVSSGANVIIDDLGFFAEPYFEDGPVAEAADSAVAQGVTFVSAGGNDATQHYQDLYVDADAANASNNLHDFGAALGLSSDSAMRILIPPLTTVVAVLQWNDRFGNSNNDYDLYLFNPSNGEIIDSGTDIQSGDDDPIELAAVTNDSTTEFREVDVVINRFSGQPKTLELFFNGSIVPLEYNVPSNSVFGHPAVSGVIAVGAVRANNPNANELFSSQGPASIFFPFFESRPKPDVVAPDRVTTSIEDFNPFIGTSASAPHVAGVVALMLDADPTLTPSTVANILNTTAVDLGASGFDSIYGFGLVDAAGAVDLAVNGNGGGSGNDNGGGGCSTASRSPDNIRNTLASLLLVMIPAGIIGFRRIYYRKV